MLIKVKNIIKRALNKVGGTFKIHVRRCDYKYLSISSLDPLGRVFTYKNEIYRGIYNESISSVLDLFNKGLVNELCKKGYLVNSCISNIRTDEYSLVLKHERLIYNSPTEWTCEMIKDAMLLLLKINEICHKYGYELRDGHLSNIVFKNQEPVLIDLGSIKLKDNINSFKNDFFIYSVVPFVLMVNNLEYEAYSYLFAQTSLKLTYSIVTSLGYKHALKLLGEQSDKLDYDKFDINWIEDYYISNKKINKSYWGNYQNNDEIENSLFYINKSSSFKRFYRILELLKIYTTDATSLLDLAGSTGLFSMLVSLNLRNLKNIINTDYDSNAISYSYNFLKKNRYLKINNFLVNFMSPTRMNVWSDFKSDVVIALAITHHLVLTQGYKLEGVLDQISKYSNKYVYVEFMPLGLWAGDINSLPEIPKWYTEEWFESIFKKQFNFIMKETIESHVINGENKPHRVLYIGKIKK